MSAPYSVWINDAGNHRYIECDTFDEALAKAQEVGARRYRMVTVIGDGAEGGYGDDGTGWWDGLTEDEHERAEAVLG